MWALPLHSQLTDYQAEEERECHLNDSLPPVCDLYNCVTQPAFAVINLSTGQAEREIKQYISDLAIYRSSRGMSDVYYMLNYIYVCRGVGGTKTVGRGT